MPIYEYACESCGHQFEKLVRIGAAAPPCPACESEGVRKRVSQSGFILKGSGWYRDHYGLKKSSGSSAESGGSSGDSGKSSSGGSGSGASAGGSPSA